MRRLYGLLVLTFRELWAKRIVLGLFVIVSLVLLVLTIALNVDAVEGSLEGLRLLGDESASKQDAPPPPQTSVSQIVVAVEALVAGVAYWVGILLAIFASTGLFSDLQAPGRVELVLSKPLSRLQVLAGHVLGVWAAIAVLLTYLMGGTWLIMSLKSGLWNGRFLLSILIVLGMFAVMYAAVVLMNLWTESTALTLIVVYGLIFASLVLAGTTDVTSLLGPVGTSLFWGLYHILPNFAEVTTTVTALAKNQSVSSWYPLVSSVGFGAAMYALAGYFFARRDF